MRKRGCFIHGVDMNAAAAAAVGTKIHKVALIFYCCALLYLLKFVSFS